MHMERMGALHTQSRLAGVPLTFFYQLDGEVVNLPHMADACNESDNLAERDSSLGTAVPDHCIEGAAVWGVRMERNLSQRRQGGSGQSVKVAAVGRLVQTVCKE